MRQGTQSDRHIVGAQQRLTPTCPSCTELRRDEQRMLPVQDETLLHSAPRGWAVCTLSCTLTLQAGLKVASNHRPVEWRSRHPPAWPLMAHMCDPPVSTQVRRNPCARHLFTGLVRDPGGKGQEGLSKTAGQVFPISHPTLPLFLGTCPTCHRW